MRDDGGCGEMLRVEAGSGTGGMRFFSLRLKKDMVSEYYICSMWNDAEDEGGMGEEARARDGVGLILGSRATLGCVNHPLSTEAPSH